MASGISNLNEFHIDSTRLDLVNASKLEVGGFYRNALVIYRVILEKQKLEYGDLFFETVRTKHRIAKVLYILREYEEALPLFEEVSSRMKALFGPEEVEGLFARGCYANILRKTGKDALPIYQEIYEIQSKHWPNEQFTLSTRINIALELCDQGELEESIKIFDELCSFHVLMKSDQKSIWATLANKSSVLCKQGNYNEAEFINKFLHKNKKCLLGEIHPETIMALRCLAIILADQNEYEQAESMLKAVIAEQVKRREKAEIAPNKWFLAFVLKKHGKLDESLSLFKELYAMLKIKPSETITLLTAKLLAKILDQQGEYEEALCMYKEVQEMDTPDSPDNLITLKNITRITDQQGDSEKSGPSPDELYQIESKKFWEMCEDCEKTVAEYK